MNYTHVFWDWNGTLLDDVDYCIATVNRSLSLRSMLEWCSITVRSPPPIAFRIMGAFWSMIP